MAYFTKLKPSTNVVVDVKAIGDDVAGEDMSLEGEEYMAKAYGGPSSIWKQTSDTGAFRKHFAGRGWIWREDLDAFITAQPYPSWTLNTTTCEWEPPVPLPEIDPESNNPPSIVWDEDTQEWVPVSQP